MAEADSLAEVLGHRVGELPTIYLGMPLGSKSNPGIRSYVQSRAIKPIHAIMTASTCPSLGKSILNSTHFDPLISVLLIARLIYSLKFTHEKSYQNILKTFFLLNMLYISIMKETFDTSTNYF